MPIQAALALGVKQRKSNHRFTRAVTYFADERSLLNTYIDWLIIIVAGFILG